MAHTLEAGLVWTVLNGGLVRVLAARGNGTTLSELGWRALAAIGPRTREPREANREGKPAPMSNASVIHVIDDDPIIRDSVGLVLARNGFCVQTHDSASQFLDHVDPDNTGCVITDVCMPGMSGIELLGKIKERGLLFPVVVITGNADIPLAVQAIKKGAVDFIEKPFDDEALLSSLRQALTQDNDIEALERKKDASAKFETLTDRENEVLAGLLKGKLNKIIAHELGISPRTVEVHRANIMHKMQAKSLAELIRMSLAARFARRVA
jgi:two-component system, LuxR family, response regulator FixJ